MNLLLNYPEGCFANCSYCGLARERPGLAQDNTFIRVGWPVYPTDVVAGKIAEYEETVGHVCIAQVQDPRAYRWSSMEREAVIRTLRELQAEGIRLAGIPIEALAEAIRRACESAADPRGQTARGCFVAPGVEV